MSAGANFPPVIPSWLDDYELTTTEFRVICHLWRRAGRKGTCFPAAPSIIRICRVSERTLWPTLRSLEGHGLLKRKKVRRNSNSYELAINPPRVTAKQQVTQSLQNGGLDSLQIDTLQSPQNSGCQSLQNGGRKGVPSKESNKESSVREAAPSPSSQLVLTETQRAEAMAHYRLDDSAIAEAIIYFSRYKAPYPDECTHDIFMVWFDSSTPGREFLKKLKATKPMTERQIAEAILEPHGNWSATIKDDPDLSTFAGREWSTISEYYQKRILVHVGAKKRAQDSRPNRINFEHDDYSQV